MRNNPFIDFWLLLVASLLIFIAYSFSDSPHSIELKQSELSDFFYTDTTLANDSLPIDLVVNSKPVMDSSSQSILLIGDSMLEGLSPRLLDYATHNGHTLNSVVWYSSTTKYFGQCDTLAHFIREYRPSYIFISLGANELFVKNIKKERQEFVEHILAQIDTIPYIWIGPPNWKPDTGINELIVENVGKSKYYPSIRLKYDRTKDGAHPTHASSARWIDSVAQWVMDSSAYPILLNRPDTIVNVKGNGIRKILQPIK